MRYDNPYDDGSHEPVLVEAVIANTATTVDDDVRVTIPSRDDGPVGPCRWEPRAGSDGPELPAAGDWALVGFSDEDTPCILLWSPA